MSGTFVLRSSTAPCFRFVVAARACTLGRSNRCDFVVDHPSISRVHAKCGVGEKGLVVTDLDSRNGTFVDNQRIQEGRVLRGQMLRFGRLTFVVAVEDLHLQEEQPSSDEEEAATGGSGPGLPALLHLRTVELLSDAQRRVFDLLLSGDGEKGIACRLDLSPHTGHNHVRAIFQVFEVHSRSELVARLLDRAAR